MSIWCVYLAQVVRVRILAHTNICEGRDALVHSRSCNSSRSSLLSSKVCWSWYCLFWTQGTALLHILGI